MCGGTEEQIRRLREDLGLSPRVRGNRYAAPEGRLRSGSIPACAGEPWPGLQQRPRTEVYPRVCGGTACQRHPPPEEGGLSPRVRGNPIAAHAAAEQKGSIPACAGEPSISTATLGPAVVYPRVCGGTARWYGGNCWPAGLSPRVRGNPAGRRQPRTSLGSIPACAGEPLPAPDGRFASPVYPRVCGGTSSS